eukprot:3091156-Lingulodinium_polyedra.AAC.1
MFGQNNKTPALAIAAEEPISVDEPLSGWELSPRDQVVNAKPGGGRKGGNRTRPETDREVPGDLSQA